MPTLNVYWRTTEYDSEEKAEHVRQVARAGMLTDEHQAATPDQPVLVEERSTRVYRPGELPPDAVLYVEDHPGPLPLLAERARQAGFRIEHAERDPGLTDRPREIATGDEVEEAGQRRREWFTTPPAAESPPSSGG